MAKSILSLRSVASRLSTFSRLTALGGASLVFAAYASGCSSSSDAGNCTVVQSADGSAKITCPDGSSASVAKGGDGKNGSDGAAGASGKDGANGAPGPVGDAGAVGATGEAGADGADGDAGLNALVLTTSVDPGAQCVHGGVEIQTGLDTNRNGALDPSEVTSTEYVCSGAFQKDVTFPSAGSAVSSGGTLGAGGGGAHFVAGDALSETFDATGLASLTSLHLVLTMDDHTSSYCTVGTLSWDVAVNGTKVGTYGYAGGGSAGHVPIDQYYAFGAIPGAGASADSYTVTLTATTTVCSGGGSWNWVSPGTTSLRE